jgi:hypothetical protein
LTVAEDIVAMREATQRSIIAVLDGDTGAAILAAFETIPLREDRQKLAEQIRGRVDRGTRHEAMLAALFALDSDCRTANHPAEIRKRVLRYEATAWKFDRERSEPFDARNAAPHAFLRAKGKVLSERQFRRRLDELSKGCHGQKGP